MGLNYFKFTGTFLLLHLFGTCLCTMSAKHYRLVSSATRVASDGFKAFSSLSRVRCFVKCTANLACHYVSYDDVQGGCILSLWNDTGSISSAGWSLYRFGPSGPNIGEYDVNVGNHIITISSQRVTKTEAENLCVSSGFGRLVEIRSTTMFQELANYLQSLPKGMRDVYGDISVAGVYDGINYRFPDGSLVPITAANDADTDGTLDCLVIGSSSIYLNLYNDMSCTSWYSSFMCEHCYYVSYDDVQGGCILSLWNDGGSISAAGWSLYRLDPPGPNNGIYDVIVGGHSLTISSQRVSKTEAENLCVSSGFGRLVEIRSEQMYLDIADYLINLPQGMKNLYGDIWIAAHYDGDFYRFPDGSLLPITAANDGDTSGSFDCLVMRSNTIKYKGYMYMYDDVQCTSQCSFICERI